MTEVHLWRDQASLDICIAIVENRAGCNRYAAVLQDGGGLKYIEVKPGEVIPLVLRIPRSISTSIRIDDSLKESLPKSAKNEEKPGAIEAMRYHLEDLRTILRNQGMLQESK